MMNKSALAAVALAVVFGAYGSSQMTAQAEDGIVSSLFDMNEVVVYGHDKDGDHKCGEGQCGGHGDEGDDHGDGHDGHGH